MMRLSHKSFGVLNKLIDGQSIAASSLRNDIAAELLDEGLISVYANGMRRTFRAIKPSALRDFLNSRYEDFKFLESYNGTGNQKASSRARQAKASGNSKLLDSRSCSGFPINCYSPIECRLAGNDIIANPPEGSFYFISDWMSFRIPEDVIVIGIENMENFIEIRKQRFFFTEYIDGNYGVNSSSRLLFVSRYPQSTDLRSWLQSIPNRYVHFGDFDLAGISIFLNEFHNYLGERATFLIPEDIECRLALGSRIRYNGQYVRFNSLKTTIPELNRLICMINTYHRCYDQEGYID